MSKLSLLMFALAALSTSAMAEEGMVKVFNAQSPSVYIEFFEAPYKSDPNIPVNPDDKYSVEIRCITVNRYPTTTACQGKPQYHLYFKETAEGSGVWKLLAKIVGAHTGSWEIKLTAKK